MQIGGFSVLASKKKKTAWKRSVFSLKAVLLSMMVDQLGQIIRYITVALTGMKEARELHRPFLCVLFLLCTGNYMGDGDELKIREYHTAGLRRRKYWSVSQRQKYHSVRYSAIGIDIEATALSVGKKGRATT